MANFRAFTLKPGGLLRELKTSCGVCEAFDPKSGGTHPQVLEFVGLWDTGATGSMITLDVANKLGLKPIGKMKVFTASGSEIRNVYKINLLLLNGVGFHSINVVDGNLTGMDVLIGMDIIAKGDFSITNVGGNTCFSFRYPSVREVNFAEEGHESDRVAQTPLVRKMQGPKFTPPKSRKKKRR